MMLALLALLVPYCQAQTWTRTYEANRLPQLATPWFHVEVGEGGRVATDSGVLRITSGARKEGAFIAIGTTAPSPYVEETEWGRTQAWDASQPTTVEVRMRVVDLLDGGTLAGMIQVSDGVGYWMLEFGADGLYGAEQRVLELDTTEFHTYRITCRDGFANAFLDGEPLPQECLVEAGHARNALLIGDFSSAVAGVTEWDYIRWTHREATPFTPPERTTLMEVDPRFEVTSPRIRHRLATAGASAALGEGRVLLAYSGPVSPHGQPPGTCWVYGRASEDGGETWGDEMKLINDPECQACGPAVLRLRDGKLRMVYMGFHKHLWKDGNPVLPDDRSDLWSAVSRDGGRTWVDRKCIWEGYTGATNGLIQAKSGAIVVPFSYYVSDPGRLVSACVVSKDNGRTWELGDCIDMGGAGDHSGAIEPAVVQLRDGRILMMIRTQNGSFYQAFSSDDGMTWTEPEPTALAAPNSPCHIQRLASGRLAIAWNNTMATTKARDSLWVALSDDEAKTWSEPVMIARSEQLSYPCIIEVSPGRLMITANHVRKGWSQVTPVVFLCNEDDLL